MQNQPGQNPWPTDSFKTIVWMGTAGTPGVEASALEEDEVLSSDEKVIAYALRLGARRAR
jgi:hypothetical protein